jgi:hypothetical protein
MAHSVRISESTHQSIKQYQKDIEEEYDFKPTKKDIVEKAVDELIEKNNE